MRSLSSSSPELLSLLQTCEAQLLSVLSTIERNHAARMLPQLGRLRVLLFDAVRQVLAYAPPEAAATLAGTAWPYNLALLKLTAYDTLSADEKAMVDSIKASYALGPASPDFARNLLAARLLVPVFDAPTSFAWREIPSHVMRSFLEYQFESTPSIVAGDSEHYCRHLERVMANTMDLVQATDTPAVDRVAAVEVFFRDFCRSHFMVADWNSLPIMRARYTILSLLAKATGQPSVEWTPPPRISQKIRLGITVRTLLAGTETWAMLANLGALDRDRYEIILFCFAFDTNYRHDIGYYRELLGAVDDIVMLQSEDYKNCVSAVRGHNLDILRHHTHVGLSDTSATALVLVHKLARLQLTNLVMHAATTGNPYFQYFINFKPLRETKERPDEFSETELYLPGIAIYVPDDWRAVPNLIVSRATLNIPAAATVYFSGAAAGKYSAEQLIAWLEIIREVPNSYLVLYPFNPAWSPNNETIIAYHARLKEALERVGVDLDRIRILDHMNGEAIAAMHKEGDIHLSSFPYGGVTTLSDALRGGLAVVCSQGATSRANGDAHILAAFGLQDLIAEGAEDYKAKAVRFGRDARHRADVKARVRDAWTSKHGEIKRQVALAHAGLIDHMADHAFGGRRISDIKGKTAG
jgi:predicted O-linked N-acetylglucosamine transferase (SPINDLY family)